MYARWCARVARLEQWLATAVTDEFVLLLFAYVNANRNKKTREEKRRLALQNNYIYCVEDLQNEFSNKNKKNEKKKVEGETTATTMMMTTTIAKWRAEWQRNHRQLKHRKREKTTRLKSATEQQKKLYTYLLLICRLKYACPMLYGDCYCIYLL